MGKRSLRVHQSSKEQTSLVIIVLLVVILLAFAPRSTRLAQVRYAPTAQYAFWKVDGQTVATATVGSEIRAHMITKDTEEYACSVRVKIGKLPWPETDYYVVTVPVNLIGGQEKEAKLTFFDKKK